MGSQILADMVMQQFTDVFRIGMIIFLAITSANTAHATPTRAGRAAPLVLGVLFIAVLIPVALGREGGGDVLSQILVGVLVNAVLLAIVMAIMGLAKRGRS